MLTYGYSLIINIVKAYTVNQDIAGFLTNVNAIGIRPVYIIDPAVADYTAFVNIIVINGVSIKTSVSPEITIFDFPITIFDIDQVTRYF